MKKLVLFVCFSFYLTINLSYSQQATQTASTAETVTPETALDAYLKKIDPSYTWKIHDQFKYGPVTAYTLELTSQTWMGHVWKHQLTVVVPKKLRSNTGLMFIEGGSSDDNGDVRWRDPRKDAIVLGVAQIALQNKAVVAVLRNVPRQPLYGGKREDALISMTLHNFKNDGDYNWPLLFPMTKSAIRAMDAVQELVSQQRSKEVSEFVVSGASKRGWTTWLTAASGDPRVKAIAPMVIDILNMPVNLNYQLEAYNEYSEEIQDYTDLEIPQTVNSPKGQAITTMIDPYSYRHKLTVPKMIFNGTNDPFWVIDAVKHYLPGIPGENYLHYVPNAGHNLGDGKQAIQALGAFFSYTAKGKPYPITNWTTHVSDGQVHVTVEATKSKLVGVRVWEATSTDRDFRNETWVSRDLGIKKVNEFVASVSLPANGYKAFYVDLIYKDANGKKYSQSTRAFMVDSKNVL
jgi:PhoPQ-activated pathogenicity-related protein